MPIPMLPLDNALARLGPPYAVPVIPSPLPQARLLHGNAALAAEIGLDAHWLDDPEFIAVLAGNHLLGGGAPVATVYAGHQFGVFVPQLGDGRAILLGQLRQGQALWDLQLKGAGQTPYSRFADGRAVIRSSVREYLASEAMHGLGVPTTRALSLVISDEPVRRERIERAAVVCRVAPTHLRFGHFEFYYYRDQHAALAPLADHVIDHHFPDLSGTSDRYERWLGSIIERSARLVAQWQGFGFCHGVLNTDNMSIIGLTLDYGPYGFIDGFDANHICNHSDEGGRYAYGRQPEIVAWNCSRLLQACLPLLDSDPNRAVEIAQSLLDRFSTVYADAATATWRRKLGLRDALEGDEALINRFLTLLHQSRADFTLSFRRLAQIGARTGDDAAVLRDTLIDVAGFDHWLGDYRARLDQEGADDDAARTTRMNTVNPKYVLRNHLAQIAIEEAEAGGSTEIDSLMRALRKPFDEQPEFERYAAEPPDSARHLSVSCSS